MLRIAAKKVAWVGRTVSTVFGLALVMALVVGVASTALAGNLDPLRIGSLKNVATKTTALVGKVATSSTLVVKNPSGGSALGLEVVEGQPPLSVNEGAGKATNLDADELDGLDSVALLPGGDLPTGRTLRGHYAINGIAAPGAYGLASDSISFGYRLASAPGVQVIKSGQASTTECPGTASSPEANPGHLCIYEASSTNLYSSGPSSLEIGSTTRNGSSIAAYSRYNEPPNAGIAFGTNGTWAVTGD